MKIFHTSDWHLGRTLYGKKHQVLTRKKTINQEIRIQIDRVWEAFWTGGLSNPLTVIEQMTYLLFIKRLDEIQTPKESKARITEMPSDA